MSHPGSITEVGEQSFGVERSRGILGWLDRSIGFLVRAAMVVSCLCVAVIIALGVADIVGRTLFNAPVMGTVEITEALLATTIFLALAYALEQQQHIVVDVVTQSLGRRMKLALHFLALLAMLAVVVLLAWQNILSADRAWQAKEVAAGYIPVPIWLAKLLAAAGLCITVLEALRQLAWLVRYWDLAAGRRLHPHTVTDQDMLGEV